jgi:hypothetical protein
LQSPQEGISLWQLTRQALTVLEACTTLVDDVEIVHCS